MAKAEALDKSGELDNVLGTLPSCADLEQLVPGRLIGSTRRPTQSASQRSTGVATATTSTTTAITHAHDVRSTRASDGRVGQLHGVVDLRSEQHEPGVVHLVLGHVQVDPGHVADGEPVGASTAPRSSTSMPSLWRRAAST